jgi:hypothetical protein
VGLELTHDAPALPISPVIESIATMENVSCAFAVIPHSKSMENTKSRIFFMAGL